MTIEAVKHHDAFDFHSRRAELAGRDDAIITAMTYLGAAPITVVTRAQLLSALRFADKESPR